MAVDRVEAINALLVQTMEAHGVHEATELQGVYDQEWPSWYASYAVEHGMSGLLGHEITTEQLAAFLASSNVDFEVVAPKPVESWAAYTAARIAAEL